MTTIAATATLAWGYTMADIDDMARRASRIRRSSLTDPEESVAIAWLAIIEVLYAARECPSGHDLVNEGKRALSVERDHMRSHYGYNQNRSGDGDRDYLFSPRFNKYWSSSRDEADDGFSDRLTDRLALPAVLSVLTADQYDAIATLAAFDGDTPRAAAALGLNYRTYRGRVTEARKRILALWFEHETPRSKMGNAEQCLNGHRRTEHGYMNSAGAIICRLCAKSASRRTSRRSRRSNSLDVA